VITGSAGTFDGDDNEREGGRRRRFLNIPRAYAPSMALLQKIKEKLGFGTGSAERDDADTEVTVESDPAADGEAGTEGREETDPAAAGAEAAASTGSLVDEEGSEADGTEASEVDAVDAESDDAETADTAAEQAEAADAGADAVAVDDDVGTDLEEIKGIGPAYAERLAEIGIDSVEDLAAADAAAVAEGTSVGESRAATWIERAKEF
jgi:predicted flap endonuclease-1-like 5' DNA nuclease